MKETTILTLHLLSPLPGTTSPEDLPWAEANPSRESLFWAFNPDTCLSDILENGPKLSRPLPQPSSLSRLDPGNYYFLQWREGAYETVEDGLDDFLGQLWWEGKACKGPLILRVLNEEGRRTFQALQALA